MPPERSAHRAALGGDRGLLLAALLAHVASDELPAGTLPDGLDHRVFVRQAASCKIPEYAQALTDPATPPPERAPTPTLICRHSRTLRVTAFYPTVYGLAALARRRGDDPRRLVPQLDVSQLDAVEAQLAEHGVLQPSITASGGVSCRMCIGQAVPE
ncbi:MAG: hypothetical protein R3A51_10765 [Nannocystaceae bacterium]